MHANNYLALEAKKHGFPVDNAFDHGAIELGNRNLKGVNDLKGEILKKLLPFPVLDAELNKQQSITREEIRQANRKGAYKVVFLDHKQSFYTSARSSLHFKSVKPKQLTTYQQSEVVNNQAANIKMESTLSFNQ